MMERRDPRDPSAKLTPTASAIVVVVSIAIVLSVWMGWL